LGESPSETLDEAWERKRGVTGKGRSKTNLKRKRNGQKDEQVGGGKREEMRMGYKRE